MKTVILGGGLAGISSSFYLGHENCLIIEKEKNLGGHASTYRRDGAYWDEGPHVSFTKHQDIKDLLTECSSSDLLEFPANVGNYYRGHWIPHPAQTNLCAIPEPLAGRCYQDFLDLSKADNQSTKPTNYQQWLDQAFGHTFSRTFPHAYTRKYWTCDPLHLSVDWVGERIFRPNLETISNGYKGVASKNTHYINLVRYPLTGGFQAFFKGLQDGSNFIHDEVSSIDLARKSITLLSGKVYHYKHLVSTIPLDRLINLIVSIPTHVKKAASRLRCTSLLLVNILGKQSNANPNHWIYVYDEDKLSTRITQTHLLSTSNTPAGLAGLQVEVYSSAYRPFVESFEKITKRVVSEIIEMELLDEVQSIHTHYTPYANIIFDNNRREAQDIILSYLHQFGLIRETDDLEPMSDWGNPHTFTELSSLSLAGRFGQWKYFWSDDCILRGKQIASKI